VARGEPGGVEHPHGRVVLRRESDLDVLGQRPLAVDRREAEALADHLDVVQHVHADPQPGVRDDVMSKRLDAAGSRTRSQRSSRAVGRGVLALRVHRLRAGAVRVEQEAAVVEQEAAVIVRAVERARAGAPSSR
jgi:hypothetical protein